MSDVEVETLPERLERFTQGRFKLYEVASVFRQVDDLIEAANGEITEEIEGILTTAHDAFTVKVNAVCSIIRERELEVEALKAEETRLAQRRRTAARAVDSWKDYLEAAMAKAGVVRVKDRFAVTKTRNSRPAINWGGEGEIPEKLRKAPPPPPPPELDTSLMYTVWKSLFDAELAALQAQYPDEEGVLLAEAAAEKVATLMPEGVVTNLGTHLRIR